MNTEQFIFKVQEELASLKEQSLYKQEIEITSDQDTIVNTKQGEMINFVLIIILD